MKMSMFSRSAERIVWLVIVALVTATCGSPTSPSGQDENVTWTVNGQSFSASSNGRAASRTGGLFINATNCGSGPFISLSIQGIDTSVPGTYAVGQGVGKANISWTPDARNSNSPYWSAPGGQGSGSGSVTISAISNDWVSGTFSADLPPQFGNPDTTNRAVQGSFELSFRERVIC